MKIDDLKAFFVVKELVNLTTEMNLLITEGEKSNSKPLAETIEYDDTALSIETKSGSCNVGQLISLKGIIVLMGRSFPFFCTGKIINVHPLVEGRQKIGIKFYEYDQDIWRRFVARQRELQNSVDDIFFAIKGQKK